MVSLYVLTGISHVQLVCPYWNLQAIYQWEQYLLNLSVLAGATSYPTGDIHVQWTSIKVNLYCYGKLMEIKSRFQFV